MTVRLAEFNRVQQAFRGGEPPRASKLTRQISVSTLDESAEASPLETATGSTIANFFTLRNATISQQSQSFTSIKINTGFVDIRPFLFVVEDNGRVPSGGFFHVDAKSNTSIRIKFDDAIVDFSLVVLP